ncbi:MAG: 2-C-methyl-D-erythritol 4-phosphate cytidylyltransferase, partial [Lachnospiraceae bacterium]|nr:2-C-methyl-D-erythritol 4-phosphate cytidylyltransferase [Lachnospiraceae bacterium]
VHNALDFIRRNYDMKDTDHILIHDSARPFITKEDIQKLNDALSIYDVVSLATRTTDTIKYVEKEEEKDGVLYAKVEKTIDRQKLWNMLTPQGFKYKVIKEAYDKFFATGTSQNITDDLQIIENFSDSSAYLIEGSKYNVKITTNEDLKYLE